MIPAWLIKTWPAFVITAVYLIVAWLMHLSYDAGMEKANEQWQIKATQTEAKWQEQSRQILERTQKQQREIEGKYQAELENAERLHKQSINEILDAWGEEGRNNLYHLRNVRNECGVQSGTAGNATGSKVSGKSKTKSDIACYSKEQLLRQVAESVAIGQECDREMIRFKALIEACK